MFRATAVLGSALLKWNAAAAMLLFLSNAAPASGAKVWLPNAGFEEGFVTPWGTGQHGARRPTWWNSGRCQSTATIDTRVARSGTKSLHIVNHTPRARHCFGTTQQPFGVVPGRTFRISLWARAKNLASDGAVSIIVDPEWQVCPIRLPDGTYGWTEFSGTFSLPHEDGQIRILCEERGEVWIDDFSVELVEDGYEGPPPPEPADLILDEEVPVSVSDHETRVPPSTAADKRKIANAVVEFRQLCLLDYAQALDAYAAPGLWRAFLLMNERIWPDTEPRIGWSFFMNVSVVAFSGADERQPLVAFYNPWADVFLVTLWQPYRDRVQMTNAVMLMGDWVRTRDGFPQQPVPAWLRIDLFKPAALGICTARSVKAFETTFASADASTWRYQLAGFDDPKVVYDVNYTGAASMLADALDRIDAFQVPENGEHPVFPVLREATRRAVCLAAAGKMAELLQEADETLPDVKDLLRKTPSNEFENLTVVSTVIERDAAFVFLSSIHRADYSLSLLVDTKSGNPRIKRIDAVLYDGIYRQLEQIERSRQTRSTK